MKFMFREQNVELDLWYPKETIILQPLVSQSFTRWLPITFYEHFMSLP